MKRSSRTLWKSLPAIVMLVFAILFAARPAAAQTTVFQHPGVLVSRDQLDFIKAEVAAKVNPFYTEFLNAQASIYGQATPYTVLGPYPGGVNQCGSNSTPDNGCKFEDQDSTTAYVQALLWYITGNTIYATNAINILNAYGHNLQGWAGFTAGIPCPGAAATCSNGPLQAAWDSTKWPRAAEIMRYSNSGWAAADITAFSNMLTNVYEPIIYNGSGENGNWELSMIEGMMGIAVFNEDSALLAHAQLFWQQRVPAYFYYFPIDGSAPAPFPRNSGSTTWNGQAIFDARVNGISQETCRDMKHAHYGISSAIAAAETDHIQGGTLFESQEARLIAGLEFNANIDVEGLSNSGTSLPVPSYMCSADNNTKERYTVTTGEGYTFVIGYNEFHNRLAQPLPNTLQWITQGVLPVPLPIDVGGHMTIFEPLTHSADASSANLPDFSLTASPTTQTIAVGGSTTYTITLSPLNGYTGNVTLSVAAGLPTNATATFSPTTVNGANGTSTLTVTTTSSVTPGTYTPVILATDGNIGHTTSPALVISGPTITITANDQAMAYGAATPTLTYTQTPSAALHILPTCVTTTTSTTTPGVYPGAITCSGASKSGYGIVYVAGQMTITTLGTITITANDQTMSLNGIAPAFTYTVSPSATTLDTPPACTSSADGTVAGTFAGAISCTGAAKAGYTINYVSGQLTVNALGALTITANNQTMSFGAITPALTYAINPNVALDAAPVCSTTANGSSTPGVYAGAITCSGATKAGYSITYAPGQMTVNAATATVTANDQSMIFGASLPALTYAIAPNVSLDTAPVCTSSVNGSSAPGVYAGAITCSGAVKTGYAFTYVAGKMTITAAAATITANNQAMTAGAAVPTLTYSSAPVVITYSTAPICATTGTSSSAAGTYPITCTGAVSTGYAFTYVPGTLTITAAANPVPSITNLAPPNLQSGGAAFTLAVTGANFINGSVVSWNGSARTTTFVDASHLTAAITASDLAPVGTASITVTNPSPGGGTSAAFLFAIDTAATAKGAFTVSATSTTLNIAQGSSSVVPLTFTGLNTSAQTTAVCLNLPTGASCTFDSTAHAVTIASTSATPKRQYQITVVCAATQQLSAMVRGTDPIWFGFVLLPLGLLARRRRAYLIALLLACCLTLTLAGCGTGGTPAPVTVSATTQTSLPFIVTIQ